MNMGNTRTRVLGGIVLLAAAGCAGGTTARESEETTATSEDALSIALRAGRGYDRIKDEAAGDCVDFDTPSTPPDQQGQTVLFNVEMIEDSSSLIRKLDVSAGASVSLGFGGGDLKTQYANEVQTNDTSVFLLTTVRVANAPKQITNVRLKDEVKPLLLPNNQGGAQRFLERCGDRFVAAYRTGGTLFGVIQIKVSNRTEKEQISASLNVGGIGWSAYAQFQNAVNSNVSHKEVYVWSFQEGGRGATASGCDTTDCLLDRAKNFPSVVDGTNAVLRDVEYMDYSRLALPTDSITPVNREIQAGNFNDMFAQRNAFRDILSRYVAAVRTPEEYTVTGDVARGIDVLNGNINIVNNAMRDCYSDATKCSLPRGYTDVSTVARVSLRQRENPCLRLQPLCNAPVWTDELFEAQEACVAMGGRAINLNTCSY